jgi:uncharacterized RDD family membrane protein YckC
MNWYYALNGQQLGPVSEQELLQLAAQGTISGGSLVWREGMGDWQPLSAALPAAQTATATAVGAPVIGGYAVPEAHKDLVVQQMREGVSPMLPGAMNYAGFWIRFVAKFIDGIILAVPSFAIQFALGMGISATMDTSNPNPEINPAQISMMLLSMVIGIGIQVLYNGLLVAKYGATWGKMALGLKIVNDDGSKVSTGKAIGRVFAELVSGFTCYIGYIIAGFDSEKRSLHDHICSTRVITTR